jgi:hypothetical protein
MKKREVLASGALLLMLVAAAWWWIDRGDAERDIGASTTTAPTAPQATSAPPPPANDTIEPPDAPAVGTPLPLLWESLAPAARAGHAPSACRLALTTLACASQADTRRFARSVPVALPASELEALQAFVADPVGLAAEINRATSPELERRSQRLNDDIDRFCGPISPERRSEALALLRQAALAGVPDAQTAYVGWGTYATAMLQGTMADPTFERWMEEAPIVLTRMLDAGHPEAPGLLAEAYGRDHLHGWLYPYDPMRAVAYGQLARRIGQRQGLAVHFVEIRRSALSASQRAEADRLTEQLHAAHYAGRVIPPVQYRRNPLGTLYLGVGAPPPGKVDECAASATGVKP